MFGDTEQLVEFYNTRSDYSASFETILQEIREDKRASLLLKHALNKCEDKAEALKFAEYLCTISDSKLIFDCAFELHLKVDAAGLKNFLQI
jgi:hypothetical protein